VSERPPHLLDPTAASWEALLLAAADRVVELLTADGRKLSAATWGEHNTVRLTHPLAGALPFGRRLLDLPPAQLPGDTNMPRVQTPTHGASQRMALSPGREAAGIFHMPGGQSGHPLSPFYGAGNTAWERGEATPFLPGPAEHRLVLLPAR
jgi:penicillin amidase